jgi:4-hydroxyphenylpyruvate dioxygenase
MKIDHIHFYVEDTSASRDWFVNHMGFQALVSKRSSDTCTTVVKYGSVTIVLSSPLTSKSPVAQFLRLHPPGVADIGFLVSDLDAVMERAVSHGAKVLQPKTQSNGKWAKIAAWGSLSHTFLEGTSHSPLPAIFSDSEFLFEPSQLKNGMSSLPLQSSLFTGIDHVVLNVAVGDLEKALSWYEEVLGFQRQQTFTIQTEQSGLVSQVLIHPESGLQFPINEPTSASSQIQEFLDINQGPGIQHIALETPKIVGAIAFLRKLGLCFLPIPASYYTQLGERYPQMYLSPRELEEIASQEILVDWHKESPQALLLQTFTQPIFEKPTFFFELIERRQQAKGFGEGNFRALFEAIEREQIKRGSLPLR